MACVQLKFGPSPRLIILISRMLIHLVALCMSWTPDSKMVLKFPTGNPDHAEVSLVFFVFSPLHASSVGLILNPNTNRLSPQFHCVYDDYFETVHHSNETPPPMWEDLVINS
jgi:hypothetical protein